MHVDDVLSRRIHPPIRFSETPDTLEVPEADIDTEGKGAHAPVWHVVVWNDPINLMSYVVHVLQKIFGYPLEKATELMLQVHHEGRSIVASEEREKAEVHVLQLHQYGLQATLERVEP